MSLIRNAFSRLHYPVDVITQCVRWYLAYSLSLRNLEEMMRERGIIVDHFTAGLFVWFRYWIRLFVGINVAWGVDETDIRVRGQWKYLYRAVDTSGQTLDFLLSCYC